ncbi:hypothetical protein [Roseobacter sp. CCS2]|uniref:hypothetical protein n=1 Tax=Roseobacter sp. CCS2 TaxID=391593 RepID=UPI0012E9D0D7|nr:hypothetical protein [Roseobacter sp. CCS2]
MQFAPQPHRVATLGLRFARQCCFVVAMLVTIAGSAVAQEARMVTLKYDDGDGISGELIEANDQVVLLKGSVGLVTIPVEGLSCIGQACPAAMRFVSTGPQLTFTTTDGSVAVTGQLIEIANDQYVLATNLGELRLNVDGAICSGDGCPLTGSQSQFGGDVVLTNGATAIEGKLVGVEDGSYIMEVPNMGAIRVNAALFDCSGESCP